jgi:hypothetical protein
MPTPSPVTVAPVHQQHLAMLTRAMNPKPQSHAPQPHALKGLLQWLGDHRHRDSKGI